MLKKCYFLDLSLILEKCDANYNHLKISDNHSSEYVLFVNIQDFLDFSWANCALAVREVKTSCCRYCQLIITFELVNWWLFSDFFANIESDCQLLFLIANWSWLIKVHHNLKYLNLMVFWPNINAHIQVL